MVTAPEKVISVLAVDGTLGALHRLGFPLPVPVSMQGAGVELSRTSWNVRKPAAGLLVSLVCACESAVAKYNKSSNAKVSSKSNKRRMRSAKEC